MTDTVPLIRQGDIKKQDLLAETYLTGAEWEPYVKGAHDALVDCKLLDGLLAHFEVSEETVKSQVMPVRDILEREAKKKTKANNLAPLKVLKDYDISNVIIGRMASSCVTLQELHDVYAEHGRKGLAVCLGVQLDGKPRVTTTKKIIDKIEIYVTSNKEN